MMRGRAAGVMAAAIFCAVLPCPLMLAAQRAPAPKPKGAPESKAAATATKIISVAKAAEAALANDDKALRVYLNHGGDPNASHEGVTLLTLAANNDSPECITLLLNRGAKINLSCADGDTPLMRATRHLYRSGLDTVKLLVARGADVNRAMPRGTTPLMMACSPVSARYEDDYLEIARLFIHRGAKVNARNRMGYTALRLAREAKMKKIAALLRRAGARG